MKNLLAFIVTIITVFGSFAIFSTTDFTTRKDSKQQKDTLTFKKHGLAKKETKVTRFINEEDKNLLARLVHAEANGEPYVGKVAVANVVLNRIEHEQFPDTIEEVIHQKNAFEPVQNGSINKPASKEAVKAVEEALEEEQGNNEILYFYNPETATSDWIFTRDVVKTINNHSFAV